VIIHAIGSERRERLLGGHPVDVTAMDTAGRVLVLFESELGQPESKDRDDWRTEFRQLCHPEAKADLRVISGIFKQGRGAAFEADLKRWLAPMKAQFQEGPPGPFLFAFGPESMTGDPGQPWRAYYLDSEFCLHELVSEPPLILDRV
jgi:hypothetical protein